MPVESVRVLENVEIEMFTKESVTLENEHVSFMDPQELFPKESNIETDGSLAKLVAKNLFEVIFNTLPEAIPLKTRLFKVKFSDVLLEELSQFVLPRKNVHLIR